MTATADRLRVVGAHRLDPPVSPSWVGERMGDATEEAVALREGMLIRVSESSDMSLVRATVPAAKGLPDREFRLRVERIYLEILELLQRRDRFALRFWNYVPGIRTRTANGMSRYEIFNLGRYLAYAAWYGSARFEKRLAAASAVDHRGDDLVVHVLAGIRPGGALENPRQTPAYRYSRRFGPLPPCFSRASVAPGGNWAIVAGTSSIVGEDSRHGDDCEAQLDETLVNLAHLSATFAGEPSRAGDRLDAAERARAFARFRELRAYVVRETDVRDTVAGLRNAFPQIRGIEAFAADLCRPELLVEVEGVLCAGGRAALRGSPRPRE